MENTGGNHLVELTAEIVSAYVSNNTVVATDLPALIRDIHDALNRASSNEPIADSEELKPAIAVRRSVTPDYIICLEDGKRFKSLKRHLRTHYKLSPDEYRVAVPEAPFETVLLWPAKTCGSELTRSSARTVPVTRTSSLLTAVTGLTEVRLGERMREPVMVIGASSCAVASTGPA